MLIGDIFFIIYYYSKFIIYILDVSDRLYTRLLFHLVLILQVVNNAIPTVFVSYFYYAFV